MGRAGPKIVSLAVGKGPAHILYKSDDPYRAHTQNSRAEQIE
jgi:hypothetical protein